MLLKSNPNMGSIANISRLLKLKIDHPKPTPADEPNVFLDISTELELISS